MATTGNPNVHTIDEVRAYLLRQHAVAVKNNFSAVTNPGVGDDANDGYAPGAIWINTDLNRVYILENSTVGAASWILMAPEGGSAPLTAKFIVQQASADLSNELVLGNGEGTTVDYSVPNAVSIDANIVAGANIAVDYSTPGQVTVSASAPTASFAVESRITLFAGGSPVAIL